MLSGIAWSDRYWFIIVGTTTVEAKRMQLLKVLHFD